MKSSRIRRASALAAAGAIAFLIPALAASTAANAETRFCQTAKNSPCLGPINGCTFILGGGKYIFVDDGDTIVNGAGEMYKCVGGKWTQVSKSFEIKTAGDIFGRGLLVQGGIKIDDPCTDVIFCPIP